MRKILSLLIAVVLGVSTAFATTVYCKMTHSWWYADGAAVAVHYWGGAAETTWPGVRMEAVTGEEGTWSYDVPDDVAGLIFVRVNGSGVIADYGAKTVDLTLPTDGKNLFTITNETPSWGDPGCNGEWSVYGEESAPQPAPAAPYTMFFTYYNSTSGDGSAKLTTAEAIFDEASRVYVAKVETGIQVYAGRKYEEGTDSIFSNLKLGSSSAAGELKFILANPTEVDSIIFRAAMYSSTEGGDGFKVNGTNFTLSAGKLAFENKVWTPTGVVDTIDLVQNKASKGRFFLTSITVYPKAAEPQPQECDWDNIDFLGDGSTEQTHSNQFKVCKVGEQPNVVNIQTPGFATETGIYVNFPSAVFGEISLSEGQYVIQGAGMVLYLSAFTQEYTEVTVNWEGNDIVFTVYNAQGGTPEPTAISNTAADAEAVKVLNNGMLLIRKGNKTYNVMGQAVK